MSITCHHVFDGPGKYVPVMRQAGSERWAIVKRISAPNIYRLVFNSPVDVCIFITCFKRLTLQYNRTATCSIFKISSHITSPRFILRLLKTWLERVYFLPELQDPFFFFWKIDVFGHPVDFLRHDEIYFLSVRNLTRHHDTTDKSKLTTDIN